MWKWFDSPWVFGISQGLLSVLIAAFLLAFPWNAGVGIVAILIAAGYIRASLIRDDALEAARIGISAGNEASENYYRNLLSRLQLKDLERQALGLATKLSEITDQFLEDEYALTSKLHTLNALRDYPEELGKLGYDAAQVNDELGGLERDAMRKYRDGAFADKISGIVTEFARQNVHDRFLDSFDPARAQEPYRIITFRDAIFRIVAKSSGAH